MAASKTRPPPPPASRLYLLFFVVVVTVCCAPNSPNDDARPCFSPLPTAAAVASASSFVVTRAPTRQGHRRRGRGSGGGSRSAAEYIRRDYSHPSLVWHCSPFSRGARPRRRPHLSSSPSSSPSSSSSSSSSSEGSASPSTSTSTSELSNDEVARYSRHLVLGTVGVRGQVALKNSKVLVVGAGGLGSPCLLYLAAAGVGMLGIVDADTVDESNLQRQIIHGTSTVGDSKCTSAARRIADVNPHVTVRLYEEEFTSSSAMRILDDEDWDVVVDGSDNFPTKYLINDACEIAGLPWVYSAILAFEGQVSVFNHPLVDDDDEFDDGAGGRRRGPSYRDMLPVPPPPGDVPSCAEGGVLGVLPGAMGCIQATEAIKILLGKPSAGLLSGRVLVYDAMEMRFSEIGLRRDESRGPITELIDYQGFCAGPSSATTDASAPQPKPETSAAGGGTGRTMDEAEEATAEPAGGDGAEAAVGPHFHSIEPAECLSRLASGWTPWVLDVRLPSEHDIVSLPFTDRVVPHREVMPGHVPKRGDVLVYCKGGVRGKKACSALIDSGVDADRLYNLEGGVMRWQKDVDPSMPRY